jgi:hypothetical protein
MPFTRKKSMLEQNDAIKNEMTFDDDLPAKQRSMTTKEMVSKAKNPPVYRLSRASSSTNQGEYIEEGPG